MNNFTFTQDAWEDYLYWQVQDRKTLKKINSLLSSAIRNPYEGKGRPEPLKGDKSGKWSRKINVVPTVRRKPGLQVLNAFGEDVRRKQKCCNADLVELGSRYICEGR